MIDASVRFCAKQKKNIQLIHSGKPNSKSKIQRGNIEELIEKKYQKTWMDNSIYLIIHVCRKLLFTVNIHSIIYQFNSLY
jgi:hypothetical protein